MTEVEFHTGVADRVGFACRLLRKAYRSGARVLVTAPPEMLSELDRSLWTFAEREFLPHVRVPGGAAAAQRRTPIWLAAAVPVDDDAAAGPAPRLLINLGAEAPADLPALDRLIEVLSNDSDDVDRGRARWRGLQGRRAEHRAPPGRLTDGRRSAAEPELDRLPTLTEVLELGRGTALAVNLAIGPGVPNPPPSATPTGTAGLPLPITDADLVAQVLALLEPRVGALLEARLREALAPALARAADGLIRDVRAELAPTLRSLVEESVAQARRPRSPQ